MYKRQIEARAAVEAAYEHQGPVYMRFGRLAVPVINDKPDYKFEIGKGAVSYTHLDVYKRQVGHVTLHAGIAGGADVILLPEIPYDIDVVAQVIENRSKSGKPFTIIAVAEGAISKEDAKLKKKEYKEKVASRKYPSCLLYTSLSVQS